MEHKKVDNTIDKNTFLDRFNKLIERIGSDTAFDPDFATIDLLDSTPYRLRDIVRFSRGHMDQNSSATGAKSCGEAAARQATIDGNQTCAIAYRDAASAAGTYADIAYQASCAASKICETQDLFSDAVVQSTNIFRCKKIIKRASKNNDAYIRYFALKNKLDIAYKNYVSAARKAIDIQTQTQTTNLSLECSILHSNYVSAAEKAIHIYQEGKSICTDPSKTDSYMTTSNSICNDNDVIAIEDANHRDCTITIEESGEHEIITIDDES